MPRLSHLVKAAAIASLALGLVAACSPEVGSKEWCESMKKKDKGQWTANEAGDFAKHCILK